MDQLALKEQLDLKVSKDQLDHREHKEYKGLAV
jgi:hypothetical protein